MKNRRFLKLKSLFLLSMIYLSTPHELKSPSLKFLINLFNPQKIQLVLLQIN